MFGQRFAIFGIEVPGAALGRAIAMHQQTAAAAHLSIEILHAQLLAPGGPLGKALATAEKTAVVMPVQRQAGVAQCLLQAPFAAFGEVNLRRPQLFGPAPQLTRQRAAVVRVVEGHVVHTPAALAQGFGKVAHGAENQRDLLRVMGHVIGFGGHFGQQYGVLGWVQLAQRGQIKRQLIAKNQAQISARRYHWQAKLIGTRRRCCGPAGRPHISSCTTAWIK